MKYHLLILFIFSFLVSLSITPQQVLAAQQEDVKKEQTQQDSSEVVAKETEQADDEKGDNTSPTKPRRKPRSEIDIIAPTDALAEKEADLKYYFPAQVIQPILVGPEDHITLINTNEAPNNKGVMILLPDWHQTAASPKAISTISSTFPQQGWTTITIQPPSKPENYPSYQVEKLAREEENQQTLKDYQQKLATILTAVTEKAKNYPGIIIVAAEGHNAALLLNIYQQAQSELPNAFIMMGAHLNDEPANINSAMSLSQLDLPVLDLYLKTDSRLVNHNVKLRKKYVNQELKSNYRQSKVFNIHTGYYPGNTLVKAINGWLKAIGW